MVGVMEGTTPFLCVERTMVEGGRKGDLMMIGGEGTIGGEEAMMEGGDTAREEEEEGLTRVGEGTRFERWRGGLEERLILA